MSRGSWGVVLGAVLVVGVAGACRAGAMYQNTSGTVARAVRIEFSEPVEITSMWPSFPQRDPQGPAGVIVLSGGEIPAGGWLSFTWRPDSARVVKVEWRRQLALPACPPLDAAWSGQLASRADRGSPLDMRFCGVMVGANYGTNVINVAVLPDEYFLWLRDMHVNWVGVVVDLTVDDSMDASVETSKQNVPNLYCGFSDEELTRLIRKLRDYGFNVYLHVGFNGGPAAPPGKRVRNYTVGDPNAYTYDWPAAVVTRENWPWDPQHPTHKEFVAEFFRTYTAQLVNLARLAAENGVGLMSLGTELDTLFRTRSGGSKWPTEFSTELRSMVDSVRAVYGGMLAYEVLFDKFVHTPTIPWFQCVWGDLGLDAVGISGYFPLLDKGYVGVPTVEELERHWVRVFEEFLTPLAELYPDKPILFTEFGYVDQPGSAADPAAGEFAPRVFVDRDGDGLDDGQEEQANILEAFVRVAERYPFFRGCFLWNHMIASHAEWARSFGAMRGFDVRGKLAEPLVRSWYREWNPLLPDLPPRAEPRTRGPLQAYPWEAIPYAVSYPTNPTVGFSPDVSAARHWGLDGSRVKGIKAALFEDVLVVRLDLYEGDSVAHYGYMVGFRSANRTLYVTLRPDEYRAGVGLGGQDYWRDLGLVYGDAFEQSRSSVAVAVPLRMFTDAFPVSTLAGSTVDLHIEYVYAANGVRRNEYFFLPGAGRVHLGQ